MENLARVVNTMLRSGLSAHISTARTDELSGEDIVKVSVDPLDEELPEKNVLMLPFEL